MKLFKLFTNQIVTQPYEIELEIRFFFLLKNGKEKVKNRSEKNGLQIFELKMKIILFSVKPMKRHLAKWFFKCNRSDKYSCSWAYWSIVAEEEEDEKKMRWNWKKSQAYKEFNWMYHKMIGRATITKLSDHPKSNSFVCIFGAAKN